MSNPVDRVPTPPPFIPAAPAIPDAPPVADAPAAAPLDKETKKLAKPEKYFADLGPANIDLLIKHQITAWQIPSKGEAKIREIAERQIRYLAFVLTEHIILSDCTKFIQALGRYTNEELALLMRLYALSCPESELIQNPVFKKAAKENVSPVLEKLYLKTNGPGWESAFMQHPEELGKALIDEKERREREGIVITQESRLKPEKPHVHIAEAQPEQKTAEAKPAPKLDLAELTRKQEQRAAAQLGVPHKTLRKRTFRKEYQKTLRMAGVKPNPFGVLLRPSAPRPVREPSASAVPPPVFLRPVKKVATPPPEAPAKQ